MSYPVFFAFRTFGLCVLLSLCLLVVFSVRADDADGDHRQAVVPDIMVSPSFVFFGPKDRMQEVLLINTSNRTLTYRMGLSYNMLSETGATRPGLSAVDKGLDFENSLKFSPRQVTVPPKGRQSVRLSLRRPADLADGDYLAYFRATRLADPDQATKPEVSDPESSGVSMRLRMGIALEIPVIVQQGISRPEISLDHAPMLEYDEESRPLLRLKITRSGSYSALGRIEVFDKDSVNPEESIGLIGRAPIYRHMDYRVFRIPLSIDPPPGAQIRVRYRENAGETRTVLLDQLLVRGADREFWFHH